MSRDYDDWDCGGHYARHGSYDEYDHSDQEVYVYDQCCQNCRYYGGMGGGDIGCGKYNREGFTPFPKSNWCMDWKGKGGCY